MSIIEEQELENKVSEPDHEDQIVASLPLNVSSTDEISPPNNEDVTRIGGSPSLLIPPTRQQSRELRFPFAREPEEVSIRSVTEPAQESSAEE